eukprot:TRINITY_DN2567_c0_g1_i1.p1 TRINITY_DN2567_c0_g1~~TRINITY_DN2567_c0_g1_i1.p1  ORF type:complete len:531 (+),score=73.18 TRINITY_DN2567_c0_g1_i1:227-1594(+)
MVDSAQWPEEPRLHSRCENTFIRCWDARSGAWKTEVECLAVQVNTTNVSQGVEPLLLKARPGETQVLGPAALSKLGRDGGDSLINARRASIEIPRVASAHFCMEVLCTSYMEERCRRGGSLCQEVNRMCESMEKIGGMVVRAKLSRKLELQAWNRQKLTFPMLDIPASFRENQARLIFLHIPKNAGTAIEEAGMVEGVRWGRHWTWGTVEMPDGYWCNKYHVPPTFLPDANKYDGAEVFCVTRHPYERAVSEYKYLLSVPWGREYIGGKDSAARCSAEQMNEFIVSSLNLYLMGHRFSKDCHMIPQSDYIWTGEHQWCKDILRVEEFPDSFDRLMQSRGLNVRLHMENAAQTCPDLTATSLDHQALRLLNSVYSDDFRRLNYTKSKAARQRRKGGRRLNYTKSKAARQRRKGGRRLNYTKSKAARQRRKGGRHRNHSRRGSSSRRDGSSAAVAKR